MKLRGVFGRNVQRLRRERGLSQETLSFLAGRTRAYISSVEAGRRNATLDTVEILAKALGVEPEILVTAPQPTSPEDATGTHRAPKEGRE